MLRRTKIAVVTSALLASTTPLIASQANAFGQKSAWLDGSVCSGGWNSWILSWKFSGVYAGGTGLAIGRGDTNSVSPHSPNNWLGYGYWYYNDELCAQIGQGYGKYFAVRSYHSASLPPWNETYDPGTNTNFFTSNTVYAPRTSCSQSQ